MCVCVWSESVWSDFGGFSRPHSVTILSEEFSCLSLPIHDLSLVLRGFSIRNSSMIEFIGRGQ